MSTPYADRVEWGCLWWVPTKEKVYPNTGDMVNPKHGQPPRMVLSFLEGSLSGGFKENEDHPLFWGSKSKKRRTQMEILSWQFHGGISSCKSPGLPQTPQTDENQEELVFEGDIPNSMRCYF